MYVFWVDGPATVDMSVQRSIHPAVSNHEDAEPVDAWCFGSGMRNASAVAGETAVKWSAAVTEQVS